MAPVLLLDARDTGYATGIPNIIEDGVHKSHPLSTTAIVGLVFAGVIGAIALVWGCVWFFKLRKAEEIVRSASPSFVDKETLRSANSSSSSLLTRSDKELPHDFETLQEDMSNRGQQTTSVIMPSKAMVRHDISPEEILEYHQARGTVPKPFAPFSFAMNASRNQSPHSRSRSRSPGSPGSIFSRRASSPAPAVAVYAHSQRRNVMQVYEPVLPDELPVRARELLSIVKTYDDGWCVVGRESREKPGEIELGVVPAWVFVRPVRGLGHPERPMRSFSLDVTVELDIGVDHEARGRSREVVSWSNRAGSRWTIDG